MINIKKIRKITKKAKIKNIEKRIEERAKQGENFMGILLNSPIDGVIDKDVIDYLKSKGFKIEQNDNNKTRWGRKVDGVKFFL